MEYTGSNERRSFFYRRTYFFVKGKKTIVIDEWIDAVAKKIMEYLNNSEPIAKIIGFCVDIEHEKLIDLAGFDDFIENMAKYMKA